MSATATPRPTRSEPEGHAVGYNAADDVIGLTIVDVHWLLDCDGKITITIPERIDVSVAALAAAMASPVAQPCFAGLGPGPSSR